MVASCGDTCGWLNQPALEVIYLEKLKKKKKEMIIATTRKQLKDSVVSGFHIWIPFGWIHTTPQNVPSNLKLRHFRHFYFNFL